MKEHLICATCGTHYYERPANDNCMICADERQYVPVTGQVWVRPQQLSDKHSVRVKELKPGMYEFEITPQFAIGQRAFFITTPAGNVLWDCIPLLDEALVAFIRSKGGLQAIAISHPHYYSNMREWAETFGCQVYLHAADKAYVVDMHSHIQFWEEKELKMWEDVTLINAGGHFPGSTVLLNGNDLFCGDTMYLSQSMQHLSVMFSYPNRIPLPVTESLRVLQLLEQLPFENLYGFLAYQNLIGNAKDIITKSINKYV
ncbi:MBL fold metallo-hydrolase [Chitinophaga sp. Hz27]|uniref:MBL fold metallo-hydrolase n=1 Tax=Chitinophaga sp. Hz27 TaxID=3347169 RepID=UPI0035DDACF1